MRAKGQIRKQALRTLIGGCLWAALLCGTPFQASGAVTGKGTEADPIRPPGSELSKGDVIAANAYFRSLTAVHGKTLSFTALFAPRQYELIFHAQGGTIPGKGESLRQKVRYNDGSGATQEVIPLPAVPERSGFFFAGWYLRGNRSPDGTILKEGTRYMIANEDAEDRKLAETDGEATVARALWRKDTETEPEDGNGADYRNDGEDPADPWAETHSHNTVLEKIAAADERTAYRRMHGKTAWQYGRILFQAETTDAASYRWYVDGVLQPKTSAQLLLSEIGRAQDGAEVRCEVTLDDLKTVVSYRTRLRVFYLPEIRGTKFSYTREEKAI